MSRTVHTSRRGEGGYVVGTRARCDRCAAAVDGYTTEAADYDEALTAANTLTDAEARGVGWRVTVATDLCPDCRR